jgi:DNA-directed RNA polymerase subunit RPC12/RpoP
LFSEHNHLVWFAYFVVHDNNGILDSTMKWIRIFIPAAGAILLAAALCRFLIAAGDAQVLPLPDPMLGIPLRDAVITVGAFELVVALICLFGRQVGLQLGWLAWLGTNYVVFWIGLLAMHYHPQGTCIGGLTDPLHFYQGTTGYLLEFIPFGLVLGSYAALVWHWTHSRTIKTVKMSCPACGIHIEFANQYAGRRISCPQCQAAITLRRPANLKMSCALCGGHIEFPSHAIGQHIACPHCAKTITLLNPA